MPLEVEPDLAGNDILPRLQELGYLKFSRKAAVLTVPHRMAIHPQVESIVHPIKLQKHPVQAASLTLWHSVSKPHCSSSFHFTRHVPLFNLPSGFLSASLLLGRADCVSRGFQRSMEEKGNQLIAQMSPDFANCLRYPTCRSAILWEV